MPYVICSQTRQSARSGKAVVAGGRTADIGVLGSILVASLAGEWPLSPYLFPPPFIPPPLRLRGRAHTSLSSSSPPPHPAIHLLSPQAAETWSSPPFIRLLSPPSGCGNVLVTCPVWVLATQMLALEKNPSPESRKITTLQVGLGYGGLGWVRDMAAYRPTSRPGLLRMS